MNYDSDFLIDEFFASNYDKAAGIIKIRLFPFGKVYKGENVYDITPEMASRFHLPHFKPPLKLGSHKEETASGGSFVSLEVGSDGLYGLVSLTDEGRSAFTRKSYRYHSPEVIWPGGGIQDPKTGEMIKGPLLVGAALLHSPHLGEEAALYSVEEPKQVNKGAKIMEMTQVPTSWLERLLDRFTPGEQPEPVKPEKEQKAVVPNVDEFTARLQEKENAIEALNAQIAQMQAAQERQTRVEHFATELADETEEIHVLLAELPEEAANALVTRFKALRAEIKLDPGQTAGARGADEEPMSSEDNLDKIIQEYAAENKVFYHVAFEAVRAQRPELFANGGK